MPYLPQILIVDDNADHRRILRYQLARIGTFAIREAADGQQALQMLTTMPPDLIFMDLELPLLDGWEVIRRIRALAPPLGQVPIIAFTAFAGSREEQQARHAGCDEYWVKPMRNRAVLQQIVTALLARQALHP
jgi:two-component system, cell cycle response regulator DivK